MSKTMEFYETLGDVADCEREYGDKGAWSLYGSIRNFAMVFALAKQAGLPVKRVPSEYEIANIAFEEWPPYLQPAARAMEADIQFVRNVIMSVAMDEGEGEERLGAELKNAVREDLNAAIDEAMQIINKAAA